MSAERLSALDAAFVALDRPTTPFVVAAVLVFERAPLLDEAGEVDRARISALIARTLEDLPRYRQRLGRVPVLGHPVWIDDPKFDLASHVHFTELVTGARGELDAWTGDLLGRPLPRDQAPWQVWFVDDPTGESVALVAKVHHALLDGSAGVRLLGRLLSPAAGDAAPAPAPPAPGNRPSPGALALVRDELAHRLAALRRLRRQLSGGPRHLVRAAGALIVRGLHPAPDVGLDAPRSGGSREVARFELDLAAMRRVRAMTGATLNDVLLATAAGCLRRALLRRGVEPARLAAVRAMVPANTRRADDRATSGNRVALVLVRLPVDEPDPVTRLDRVRAEMASRRRAGHEIEASDALAGLADAIAPWALGGLLRLALARRAFNVIVTNVPGPAGALTLLGARLRSFHPIVNLWPGQSLAFAVTIQGGVMSGSVHSIRSVVGDLAPIVDDLRRAFAEQTAAVSQAPPARPGPEPRAAAPVA